VEEYRYGFNGKEQIDEMIGESNGYDFGARMYDARLGRWWSVDKMYFLEFSSSVYSYCGNSPIIYIDNGGNFKIRNNVPQNRQTANTQLAITRITNISASLGYLLSLTREVTLTDGTKSTQTILEYIMKDSGLSKAEIYRQISSGTGAILEIGENAGVPAQTPSSNLIILDIDAIDALGNPNLSNDELADLSFFWGVTILHELCHLGDRITNDGQQSGQPGMPDGKQDFKRAQEPKYHRGMSMELAFFGSTFANSLEAHTDPQTNQVIQAGMDYGDLSFEKEKVGLTNGKILSESNVTSSTPVRRTYATF
jgi:RHS repeat-associated protein